MVMTCIILVLVYSPYRVNRLYPVYQLIVHKGCLLGTVCPSVRWSPVSQLNGLTKAKFLAHSGQYKGLKQ